MAEDTSSISASFDGSMNAYKLPLALVGIAVAILAIFCLRPSPVSIAVAKGSAILYYNSPASVRAGNTFYIGYVDTKGTVTVAAMDSRSRQITRSVIHEYARPDDHAAPALWPTGTGILVATAFHSSDLFLYRLTGEKVELLCRWRGRFTYPRFDEVAGRLWLYVRYDPDGAGSLAIIKSPEDCAAQEVVFAARRDDYFYATVPDGDRTAWSVYNQKSRKHTRGFINGEAVALASSPYDETLMWSLAGPYWATTRFQDSFACCNAGEMIAELYRGGRRIFATQPMPSPYYPTGIVLSRGADEGLFPIRNQRLERRRLPAPEQLPTCPQNADFNTRPQYVLNGGGAYVWMSYSGQIGERHYDTASIDLCLLSG